MNFEIEVTNILEMKTYELANDENVQVIKNWFWWEGLQLIQTVSEEEKEICKTARGFYSILSSKF